VAPFELGEGRTRIGRGTDNHLVLEDHDKQVSRSHAEIWHERGRYVIADLNSQNGVWIGERQIKTEEPLPVNVWVTIGPYRLMLMPDEKPAVAMASTDELEPADVTGRREAYVEPTQLLEPAGTVPPASQRSHPPKPAAPRSPAAQPGHTQPGKSAVPAAKSRSNTIPIVAAVVALLVLGAVAIVMMRKPLTPATETVAATTTTPPATTSIPAPATPTPEETFQDHYGKAQAFIQQGNKTSAREENIAALAALPDDPRGVAQRTTIDAMVEPGATPAPPAVAGGTPPPGTASPKPLPPVPETLKVAARQGEPEKERATREKTARNQLEEGRKALADRQFDTAIERLQSALSTSGRSDYGVQANEASQMLRQARNNKAAAEANQRHANAQKLVEEARAAAGSDIVTALNKLREARNLDPEIEGAAELNNSFTEQARVQGEAAMTAAKNYDNRSRTDSAIKEYERAVRLLEFVPGHKDLGLAKQRLAELKSGK
jgi:predicted component of type VI protein secretion system